MNTIGTRLRMHLFGESHGAGVGCLLDGVPPGIPVDEARIAADLARRRPGTGPLVSARNEPDACHILSGVHAGHTTGAPVALWIENQDARSKDYDALADVPRPGHADLPEHIWSRGFRDVRGGGHQSGRLTAPWVAAAALLRPLLDEAGITVAAHLDRVASPADDAMHADEAALFPPSGPTASAADLQRRVEASAVHTAHGPDVEASYIARIQAARNAQDGLGGRVAFVADGVPAAWGDPWMDGVEGHFARLLFSIPAVKAVGFGAGADAASMRSSTHNDPIVPSHDGPVTTTNHAGGILGGRTTGAPVWGHVTVKPPSSIAQEQQSTSLSTGEVTPLRVTGRHDPCIAIRAVPVVRAAIELGLVDLLLLAHQQGHA